MGKFVVWLVLTLVCLVFWTLLVVLGTENGWLRDSIAPKGDSRAFMNETIDIVRQKSRGNIVFVLLENGQVFDQYTSSIGEHVDEDTVFQVASLSKWITAWGVMTLVDEGKIKLDTPVSTYLSRWQLPKSQFDNEGVTVRRLLSHTAGLTDGLGYAGFEPCTEIQTIEESLAQPHSSSPEQDHTVRVGMEPGSKFKYSGGGYTILQLLIEEISGESFQSYMQRKVLSPLGMTHSSYVIDERNSANQAVSYRINGTPSVRQQWTNIAAASFYTSISDMTLFIQAHLIGPEGQPIGRGSLSTELVELMRTPQASTMGIDIWGLGTILLASNNNGGFIIGGGGSRANPAINSDVRIDPATGNGIVVLETGNRTLATDIASEWTFWKVGKLDLWMFRAAKQTMIIYMFVGWLVIFLSSIIIGRRIRKTTKNARLNKTSG